MQLRWLYLIRNKDTGQTYLGATNSPKTRLKTHWYSQSTFLGREMAKTGPDRFKLRVLRLEAYPDEEGYLISKHRPYYNIRGVPGKIEQVYRESFQRRKEALLKHQLNMSQITNGNSNFSER